MLTLPEYQHLLPQGKDDQLALQRIQALPENQLAELSPHLLEWVQDGNWPIAPAIGRLLAYQLPSINEYILCIFRGNDNTWKYWIISLIIGIAPHSYITPILIDELRRIAYSPNAGESDEGVDEAASLVFDNFSK